MIIFKDTIKTMLQTILKEEEEEFRERFVEFTADGTKWGAGLYIYEKIKPDDVRSFIQSYNAKIIKALCEELELSNYENKNEDRWDKGYNTASNILKLKIEKIKQLIETKL